MEQIIPVGELNRYAVVLGRAPVLSR